MSFVVIEHFARFMQLTRLDNKLPFLSLHSTLPLSIRLQLSVPLLLLKFHAVVNCVNEFYFTFYLFL